MDDINLSVCTENYHTVSALYCYIINVAIVLLLLILTMRDPGQSLVEGWGVQLAHQGEVGVGGQDPPGEGVR